jgi:hypothetical protein
MSVTAGANQESEGTSEKEGDATTGVTEDEEDEEEDENKLLKRLKTVVRRDSEEACPDEGREEEACSDEEDCGMFCCTPFTPWVFTPPRVVKLLPPVSPRLPPGLCRRTVVAGATEGVTEGTEEEEREEELEEELEEGAA